jgi:hypothetical protein
MGGAAWRRRFRRADRGGLKARVRFSPSGLAFDFLQSDAPLLFFRLQRALQAPRMRSRLSDPVDRLKAKRIQSVPEHGAGTVFPALPHQTASNARR